MIHFTADQAKLMDKLASLKIKDIVTDSKLPQYQCSVKIQQAALYLSCCKDFLADISNFCP